MDLIAWPFHLAHNGAVATVEQDSDQSDAELLGVLILTRTGERALVPGFGIPDPAFAVLRPGDVQAAADLFGPAVRIDRVTETGRPGPGVVNYELAFTPADDEQPASRYTLSASGAVPDPAGLLDGPMP